MKTSIALLSAFAAAVLAQYNSSTSYTTITAYTDLCSGSDSDTATSTTTSTITSNVCHVCENGMPPATVSGVLTTYTTVYDNICPTGSTLTPATYTVTEALPQSRAGQPLPSSYIPQGFTTTVASCSCNGGSATLTVPASTAGPTAPAGAPATGSPAASSPAAGAPANAPPAGPEAASTGPAATTTYGVELASNGTGVGPAGTGSKYGPTVAPAAPIKTGAASRSAVSVGCLMVLLAVVAYAL